jgi:hypothetical protein
MLPYTAIHTPLLNPNCGFISIMEDTIVSIMEDTQPYIVIPYIVIIL